MQTIRGLNSLYELFKITLSYNQNYLDPKNNPEGYPQNVLIFEYTLNFTRFYIRGDTTKEAMDEFCKLYEERISSGHKVNNLFDQMILRKVGNGLRLMGHDEANGLYFIKIQ